MLSVSLQFMLLLFCKTLTAAAVDLTPLLMSADAAALPITHTENKKEKADSPLAPISCHRNYKHSKFWDEPVGTWLMLADVYADCSC